MGRTRHLTGAVSLKRLLSSALVVLAAFSVQAAYGAPTRATATVQAQWCCSTRCDHAKSAAAARHCCGVAQAGSEVAASPQTKLADSGPFMQAAPVEFDALSSLGSIKSAWASAIPVARARGAPLFLLTHSLRI